MSVFRNAGRCILFTIILSIASTAKPTIAAYGDIISLRILSAAYRDLDGDHDMFPDTGETGRIVVTVQNSGKAVTGLTLYLTSNDPDVSCITTSSFFVGSFAIGEIRTIGSFDPAEPGFGFRASDSLQTISVDNPAKIDLSLWANAFAFSGSTSGFSLLADLDVPPGAVQTFTLGPDGMAATPDDGTLRETFDTDRDGDGVFSTADTFGLLDTGTGVVGHGFFMHGGTVSASNVVAGIACGGYTVPAEGNPECRLDTDYPMDWHFHCPPGVANCPNTESGGFGAAGPGCVGGCSYDTPLDGQKALSPPNSLHMGAHFDPKISALGDTTHLRTLQAFVSNPINLAVAPRNTGDLKLSFFHIVDLIDNPYNEAGPCQDCAQVHVQADLEPDPAVDAWGPWDTLVPFQNVYTRAVRAWSYLGSQYCEFTPADTGTDPPAPHGVHETMCFPERAWGHCGSAMGSGAIQTYGCFGGVVDPSGRGVWVQSRFDLSTYIGRRVRIRWIGTTWQMDNTTSSYFEYGPGWSDNPQDDGWWLDDIEVTGALQAQSTTPPEPDPGPSPGSVCPVTCNASVGDGGTNVSIVGTDTNGGVSYDGFDTIPIASQYTNFLIDASGSTFPGGCLGGVPLFQYFVNNQLAKDWTASFSSFVHRWLTTYTVKMRCSKDVSCASVTGKTITLPADTQDGDDTVLGESIKPPDLTRGIVYDRLARSTTLRFWTSRNRAVDLYRGLIGPGVGKGSLQSGTPSMIWLLAGTACLMTNLPATAIPEGGGVGTSGPLGQNQDPDPPMGYAVYYLAGRNDASGASFNALGCANPGICGWGTRAGAACGSDADCPSGQCLSVTVRGGPIPPPFGCQVYEEQKIIDQVPQTALCS